MFNALIGMEIIDVKYENGTIIFIVEKTEDNQKLIYPDYRIEDITGANIEIDTEYLFSEAYGIFEQGLYD